MQAVLMLATLLAAAPVEAQECSIWQSELHEYGERVAYFDEEGFLFIEDANGKTKYATASNGTGIPGRAATPVEVAGKALTFIEHKGDLIIEWEVFEPACVE